MDVANANQHRSDSGTSPSPPAPPTTHHFVIPSTLEAGRDVQSRIMNDTQSRGYGEQSLFAIRLALEEALVNAIKHGNQFDTQKKVQVDATLSDQQVEIIVEDQGCGFSRDEIPDPRLQCNVERRCGRGLLLMESYMDHVEYGRGGRRIRMVKINRG